MYEWSKTWSRNTRGAGSKLAADSFLLEDESCLSGNVAVKEVLVELE